MHRFRTCLFQLLLTASLLGFAAAASAHDHEFTPPAADGLCAICVYAGNVPGGATPARPALTSRQHHALPEGPRFPAIAESARSTHRIRGPPSAG